MNLKAERKKSPFSRQSHRKGAILFIDLRMNRFESGKVCRLVRRAAVVTFWSDTDNRTL